MRVTYPAPTRARLLVISVAVAVALAAMSMSISMPSAWAATTTVLHNFAGGNDGQTPQGPVVFDSAGNLYGTTTFGGVEGDGTVYKLTPSGSSWTKSTIHSFQTSTGGRLPQGPLAIDGSGNLYGTGYQGGANGQGVVFRLSPGAGGTWTYSILYSFTGLNDGGLPTDSVTIRNGNLYGTAGSGGQFGQGVVYQLSPSGGGWTQTVLHHFQGGGVDGSHPGGRGAPVFDQSGNLYGATVDGGSFNAGVVYRLSPSGGTWTETLLHNFTGGNDGANPLGSLLLDASGNIYGTTAEGGTSSNGTVYKMTLSGSTWTKSVIFNFSGGANGHSPFAGVIADPAGSLYGTTTGGVFGAGGVVYKLSLSGGVWTQTVLYTFGGAGNGAYAGLIRDSAGNLYGTNASGGPNSAGQVFKVTP